MKKEFFSSFIFIFFILIFVNPVSSVAYGSGVYGQGTSCIGSVTVTTPAAGTFGGGGGVVEKYIYKGWEVIFEFNNVTYTISLEDVINNKTAVIKISGGNKNWNFNLDVNQTEKIDLNEDYIYDLRIHIGNISGDKIYITANSIQEDIFPEIETGEEKESSIVSLLVFTIVILLLIIIILIKVASTRRIPERKIEQTYIVRKKKTEHEIERGKAKARKHMQSAKILKRRTEMIKPVLNEKIKQKRRAAEEKHRKRMIQEVKKRKIKSR